jgi:hypothetical protein
MNLKFTIISILLFFVVNGLAQDISEVLSDMTLKKAKVMFPSILSERAAIKDDDTPAYDFCEANEEGIMLYYRYVEQDYCELVAGPEKYTGIIKVPPYVSEQHIPVVGVGVFAFRDCVGLTEVYLPNTMLYLETLSFYWAQDLQKVDVGENLVAIGWNAFEGCVELSSINIPQSLEYVGYEAFYDCPKMVTPLYNDKYFFYYPMMYYETQGQTYIIPDGIEVIGEGAFIFTFLDEVVIPNTVKTISEYAFDGSQIKRVNIPNSVETIGNNAFGQTCIEEITVPSSVKNFGKAVFNTGWNLKKAVLENPLDSIPEETFYNCFDLEEVTFPASVHKLCDRVFTKCESLPKLPDLSHIDTLGVEMFAKCYALKSITLPPSITYIPDNTFNMCLGVKEVNLPEGLERIGNWAFWQCPLLESITIPSSVKTIGRSAFAFCKRLKNIVLPDGLVTIGEDAFSQLEELESISLPESLENIGRDAFSYGYKLKNVYAHWQSPIQLENNIFDDYQHTLGMTLHVPAGTTERYASSPYWSDFKNIVEDATGIINVNINELPTHYSRPIKRIVDGKILIVSESSGTILIDGKRISQ